MIRRLYTLQGRGTDPYENLAVEEVLLSRAREDSCILYLWQNSHTVVIGRNQNPWTECRTTLLSQEGGRLARRLSGGGAVYHDLGNLNYTFLMPKADFDIPRQLSVLLLALERLGVPAERSGRNDLLCRGRKFSGNAFYRASDAAYHHGTLMVDVDLDRVSRYLSPSKAKLASKGVASVRSRVINLKEACPTLTLSCLSSALKDAFSAVYGQSAAELQLSDEELAAVSTLQRRNADVQWLYGQQIPLTLSCEDRFSWGGVELHLAVCRGRVEAVKLYSDAMDWTLSSKVETALLGCPFQTGAMCTALSSAELPEAARRDMIELLKQQEI